METSKLEIDASDRKYLKVFYDPKLKNWDFQIKSALEKYKIDGKCPILCLPMKKIE